MLGFKQDLPVVEGIADVEEGVKLGALRRPFRDCASSAICDAIQY